MLMVEAQNLSYSFAKGKPKVVSQLNLSVKEGEIVAIVGPSGSGKTVVAYLLSGIIPSYFKNGDIDGGLRIDGRDALAAGEDGEGLVGIVLQNPEAQLFGFRVEDTIAFGMENIGYFRDKMNENLDRVIKELRMEHLRYRFTDSLSGGQKQVCCIASVLAMDPKVLVLDEPVSALDPGGVILVQQAGSRLKETGRTIIVIDNNLEWVAPLLDRVIVMEDGSVSHDVAAAEFFADRELVNRSGVTTPQVNDLYHQLSALGYSLPVFVDFETARAGLSDSGNLMPAHSIIEASPQGAEPEVVVSARDLSFSYGDVPALQDVNLDFREGRITGIIGQNGSGKSTLLKHLNGLLKPTRGEITVRGKSPHQATIAEMALTVGFVFQNPDQMLFEESVEREASFAIRAIYGKVGSERGKWVRGLLERFGLARFIDVLPFNLSTGHKQWLTIVSAISVDPPVLVLDEPTMGMDRRAKSQLQQMVRSWKQEGKTTIIISHDLPFLAELAEDVLVLDHGRVMRFGPAREVFSDHNLFAEINIPLPQITRLGLAAGRSGVLSIGEFLKAAAADTAPEPNVGGEVGVSAAC